MSLNNNFVTLSPGIWVLNGSMLYTLSGSSPGYSHLAAYWKATNGNNTSTEPPSLDLQAGIGGISRLVSGSQAMEYRILMPTIRIEVTAETPVYLVPNVKSASSPGNARLQGYVYAEKIY